MVRARGGGVPAALVGKEVSGRVLIPIWEGVRALGKNPDELAIGSGATIEQLTRANERFSWATFSRVMTNLGAMLTDEQIVELGATAMDSPFLRVLLLPARLLFGIDDIYRFAFGPSGTAAQLIAVNDVLVVRLGPDHLRMHVRLLPGYAVSRENFLLLRGALGALARIAVREHATIDHVALADGAVFDIHIAESAGLLGLARRRFSRSDEELRRAHDELFERYNDLEREIAQRMNAEQELRRSEQRYRDLFEAAPLPMWVYDEETLRFLAVNGAAVKAYGYTPEEFAGMTIEDIRPGEDVPILREHIARTRDDHQRTWRHRTKDGAVLHVKISARSLVFGGRTSRLVHVFDMTQRLALEDQLRQAQKMEAVGQLAGGVAHDFNNLLMVISSYTELLLRDADDEAVRADLRAIRNAADRGADLTSKLLMFARRKLIELKHQDIGEIVHNMRALLRPVAAGGGIEIVYEIAERLGRVRADRGGIEQILMNLAVNARDAMPYGGRISIAVRDVVLDEDFARINVGVMPGPHVALVVSDTGTGMDASTRARIFEPFFTTKLPGQGTGLGLSTVLGIAQQNSGHIQVDTAPGRGTSIAVYFPHAEAPEVAAKIDATILVVEDDDILRAAARDVLEEAGYHVLAANDAASALAICSSGVPIELVLSDIKLPRVDGLELAKQLRAHRPDLKVLWMSGHPADTFPSDVHTAYLKKPFTVEVLVERVRSLLA
jgi:PAS domain S-box-containing protein